VIRFESTPNPNALKCVTDGAIVDGIRSYRSPEDADDALSRAVFAVPGATSVLINNNWMTVNKSPGASWETIRPAVEEILDSR